MIISCKHYAKRSILRVREDSNIFKPGLYEILDLPPACIARGNRYISTIKQWCPDVGGNGCRKYSSTGSIEYRWDGKALYYRYLGPLGDPQAEAEAARIEARGGKNHD